MPGAQGTPVVPGAPEWAAQDQTWGVPPAQEPSTAQPQAPQPQFQQPTVGAGPLPPEGAAAPGYGNAAIGSSMPYGDAGAYGSAGQYPGQGAPLPPAAPADAAVAGYGPAPAAQEAATQYIPPVPAAPVDEGATQYIPPVPAAPVDEGATQYIPPVPAAPVDEGATQYIPPVPATPVDEGATQYIPPVVPGALPPEVPTDGTARPPGWAPGAGAGPLPPVADPDAQATQYLPPVPAGPSAGGGQPPAGFENLFRNEAPGSTQQIPRFQPPGGASAPGGRAASRGGAGGRGGGRGKVPLIAAVGIGIAVLGVGAGALLGGGGDDQQEDNKTVAATTEPSGDTTSAAAGDPAKAQAVELDKLLADSNNSRDTVIRAVADVRVCANLGQAANDLRNAAQQRNDLVKRLAGLSVDKLPDNVALTAALNKAWQASASADNHYAAWADQVADKKGCRKGQARSTGQQQAGNVASGVASAEKVKAARLWNVIATKYGLAQRQATQL